MMLRSTRTPALVLVALAVATSVSAQSMVSAVARRAAQRTTARLTREAGDFVLDVGPIDVLAGHGSDPMYMPPALPVLVPADGWLHGYTVDLVDATGDSVPHVLLHHVAVLEPDQRQLFSPIMLRILAAGSETEPVSMPRVFGVRVRAGDTLMVTAMLHNPTGRDYRGVHLRMRMPFTAASSWLPALSVVPFWIDVTPPAADHAFDLPPGHSEFAWAGRPAVAGRVLGLGGHLHKYGVMLRFEDTTAHRVLWSVRPDTDATGDVTSIPISKFIWRLGLPLRPDHVYRLVAVYDNPTGHTIPEGGMGVLGGVFMPTDSRGMPPVNRADPQYQFDVRYSLEPPDSMHMTMSMPMAMKTP